MEKDKWFIYIVKCADDSFYTGITKDITERIKRHNSNNRLAARYTRSRRPVELVYKKSCIDRADASRREYVIKKLSHQQKQQLIKTG